MYSEILSGFYSVKGPWSSGLHARVQFQGLTFIFSAHTQEVTLWINIRYLQQIFSHIN
mgnify:CR=1 FL=1